MKNFNKIILTLIVVGLFTTNIFAGKNPTINEQYTELQDLSKSEGKNLFKDLPYGLLQNIFDNLSNEDIKEMRLVNRKFRDAAYFNIILNKRFKKIEITQQEIYDFVRKNLRINRKKSIYFDKNLDSRICSSQVAFRLFLLNSKEFFIKKVNSKLIYTDEEINKKIANIIFDENWTPLYYAARNGHTEIVQLLLEHGTDINARIDTGWTPLTTAARNGHTEIAEILLSQGADVNVQNNDGWTPLHLAVNNGHTEIAEILLNHGADVNVQNNNGWTPLYCAVEGGHTEIARLLLGSGAKVGERELKLLQKLIFS